MDRVLLIEYGNIYSTDLSFGATKIGYIASKGGILSSDDLITLAIAFYIGKVADYRSEYRRIDAFLLIHVSLISGGLYSMIRSHATKQNLAPA